MLFKFIKALILSLLLNSITEVKGWFASQDPSKVFTTETFFVPISVHSFGFALNSESNDIELMPSIEGMPDLPNWMHYLHANASNKAYLYGSPPINDDGDIYIEIIAINKYNYETTKDTIKFRINKREKIAKYEVEVKFVNFNIEDMFENNRLYDLWTIFSEKLWKNSEDIYITKVASPLDVGGRLPLDPREKEGVIVRVGSTDNFTKDLLWLEEEVEPIKNRETCPRKYKASSVEYMFRNKGFHSDWCSFQLIRPISEMTVQNTESKVYTTGSANSIEILNRDYTSSRETFPKRDYTMDIMYSIVIPLLIGVIVISCLTCIFFYNKEENRLKEGEDTHVQLQHYNSIQRASSQLRSLAHNRHSIAT